MIRHKYLQNEEIDDFDELMRRLAIADAHITRLTQRLDQREVYTPWIEPVWQNGYAQVDEPLEPFAYRWASSKFPVFKGHINVEGASSGDVAFAFDTNVQEDVYLPYDVRDHIVLTDDGGSSFIMGLAIIDSANMEFSLVWPAS